MSLLHEVPLSRDQTHTTYPLFIVSNFKAFTFVSALAAASAIAAPGAQAYYTNQHGVGFWGPEDLTDYPVHQALVERLEAHGIWVIDGSTLEGSCEAKPGYKLYGYYTAADNYIVICPGLTAREFLETLTHEAVHAYQDYRTGLDNYTLGEASNVISIFNKLTDAKQNAVLDYDQGDQALEAEAWYFEDKPQAVLNAWSF